MYPHFRVLLVDDDRTNLKILVEILGDHYMLASAGTGEEALRLLPEFRPDLILLDIMMPGMSGYDVCRRIRSDQRYTFVKIILVSGKDLLEERLEGYKVGADDYITKPFMDEELEAKVKVFLRLKRTEEVDQIKSDLMMLFSNQARTPLNGIIAPAEIIQQDSAMGTESRRFVDMILENSNQLLDFVDKAAFLCDLKNGRRLRMMNESVADHLHAGVASAQNAALQKDIVFQLDCTQDVVLPATWDALDRVFDYVLANAVKYSPRGGIILVQTDLLDDSIFIRISDQGDGIVEGWNEKIFDEFAIRKMHHRQKGQGISLAISRHVMERNNGGIWAVNTPGSGATFVLRLPCDSGHD